jgi:hypothetical protein
VYGINEFLLAISAAGAIGALVTVWYATSEILALKSSKISGAGFMFLVTALQLLTTLIWGGFALANSTNVPSLWGM